MKSQALNQLINFFWTILCFTPIVVFWWENYSSLLYIAVAISLAVLILPPSVLRYFQFSRNPQFYRRFGISFFKKFVQNGTYVNRAIDKKSPGYKVVATRADAARYIQTINMYERFHLVCLLFFAINCVYAICAGQNVIAAFILTANLIYNIVPIMLQQYNRLRVMRLRR